MFLELLKIAKISPIFKKGDSSLMNNYRPVSILPSISKILEKVIFKQIEEHFKINNLYFNSHYVYRAQHSTESATLELVDRLTADLDNGKIPLKYVHGFNESLRYSSMLGI